MPQIIALPVNRHNISLRISLFEVGYFKCYFYRAMHFSAKRGIEFACRPSACLSVRLSVCLWRWWITGA